LAQRLAVTKASASELITKLVANGLIRKAKDPDNTKEVLLYITGRCQGVLDDVDRRHERMFQELKLSLGELPETNFGQVVRVLQNIEYYLDRFIKESQ
jgi:DNA-binding MarR family transcriptional regulator